MPKRAAKPNGRTATQIVGFRIRQAREAHGMTQTQLGEALTEYLGHRWLKQTVSSMERGTRQFNADELLALAAILQMPVIWFFSPERDEGIVISSSKVLTHAEAMDVLNVTYPSIPPGLLPTLVELIEGLKEMEVMAARQERTRVRKRKE